MAARSIGGQEHNTSTVEGNMEQLASGLVISTSIGFGFGVATSGKVSQKYIYVVEGFRQLTLRGFEMHPCASSFYKQQP